MMTAEQVVDTYLRRLAKALRRVPTSERREMLDEISAHIGALRDDLGASADDVTAVRMLLERVGDPAAIARAAGSIPPSGRPGFAATELGSFALLGLSSLAIGAGLGLFDTGWRSPSLDTGWVAPALAAAALLLVWLSPGWSIPDKVLACLLAPVIFLLNAGAYRAIGWVGIWTVYAAALGIWFAALLIVIVWRHPMLGTRDKFTAAAIPAVLALLTWGYVAWFQSPAGPPSVVSMMALPLFVAAYLSVRHRSAPAQLPNQPSVWASAVDS